MRTKDAADRIQLTGCAEGTAAAEALHESKIARLTSAACCPTSAIRFVVGSSQRVVDAVRRRAAMCALRPRVARPRHPQHHGSCLAAGMARRYQAGRGHGQRLAGNGAATVAYCIYNLCTPPPPAWHSAGTQHRDTRRHDTHGLQYLLYIHIGRVHPCPYIASKSSTRTVYGMPVGAAPSPMTAIWKVGRDRWPLFAPPRCCIVDQYTVTSPGLTRRR